MQHTAATIPQIAREVLEQEAVAIQKIAERLAVQGPEQLAFTKAVELMYACKGRVVISGLGKSGLIGQKMVATLNSTGTPALYMHAADALHGDLGMVQEGDVAILISKSGDTAELKQLVPLLSRIPVPIIALTGNPRSYLATHAEASLDGYVAHEACPNNLAPTTSTTAHLAIGDALAVCLMRLRDFRDQDFARYHPGGSLGKRLYLRVRDLAQGPAPAVSATASVRDVIVTMTNGRQGAAVVLDENGNLLGIVTDGDLRRMLQREAAFDTLTAANIMTRNPKTIAAEVMAIDALQQMENFSISQLVVVDEGKPVALLHLHDLLREGI